MVGGVGGGSSSTRRDLGALWIDYALLPDRLDEHLAGLASGALSTPSHSDLLNMFLEQAVSNYKLARKETDAQDAPSKQSLSRTAAVLCERAVKVAVAADFTLEDVEVVVGRQIQSLLLKALIKYDKPRSLVHECDLHRWVIRRALNPSSASVSAPSVEDGFVGVEGVESQETSVTFLENVLEKGNVAVKGGKKVVTNGQVDGTTDGYLSQLTFDLGEAHFMKGRMRRAHELFTKCASLVNGLSGSVAPPVNRDRLNGFIAACRAFENSDAGLDARLDESASAGQEAIFSCEKQRLKRKHRRVVQPEHCNGLCKPAAAAAVAVLPVATPNGVSQEHKQINGCIPKGIPEEMVELVSGNALKRHLCNPKGVPEEIDLVELVSGDALKRHLSWGYCLSLVRDTSLSAGVRCRLAACNALRHVLDGEAFEGAVGMIEGHDEREAVEFVFHQMQIMAAGGGLKPEDVEILRGFCVHLCCVVEDAWCWDLAAKCDVLSRDEVSKFRRPLSRDVGTRTPVVKSGPTSGSAILDVLQAENPAAVEVGDAKLLQLRAFDSLENSNNFMLAIEFLLAAKRSSPEDIDADLLLWYTETASNPASGKFGLPEPEREGVRTPSLGVVEYIAVKLVDAQDWASLRTLYQWGRFEAENERAAPLGVVFKHAGLLCDLLPQAAKFHEGVVSPEDVPRMKAAVWHGFEELITLVHGSTTVRTLPVISKVTNVDLLEQLAGCTAGWLHRCHEESDSAPLELWRYGALAEVTSASAGRSRMKSSAPVECGTNLFRLLMERLLGLAKTRSDKDRHSKWLLSMADLAFNEEAYLRALQLYLQAGAVRSSFYCDRMACMARDFFTPWVITRMVTACKEIGARLQAIALCQCLPTPDFETAFQILHEHPMIVDRDAASYFECIWEIPILELLVNMHAKAGDRGRMNTLISLLQQPGLNVHNPASIRRAHILTMEQRFLQRFYAELV